LYHHINGIVQNYRNTIAIIEDSRLCSNAPIDLLGNFYAYLIHGWSDECNNISKSSYLEPTSNVDHFVKPLSITKLSRGIS
jgi:hypothetical protein